MHQAIRIPGLPIHGYGAGSSLQHTERQPLGCHGLKFGHSETVRLSIIIPISAQILKDELDSCGILCNVWLIRTFPAWDIQLGPN